MAKVNEEVSRRSVLDTLDELKRKLADFTKRTDERLTKLEKRITAVEEVVGSDTE